MAASIVRERVDTFHVAVSSSLSRLGLSGVSLRRSNFSAIKAVHEGQDVFVCLPTGYGRPVLPNAAISNGAQTGWK